MRAAAALALALAVSMLACKKEGAPSGAAAPAGAGPASGSGSAAAPQGSSGAAGLATLPPTPKVPVTDTLHGVQVVDDYRWLEDSKDQKVAAWNDAESARARAFLDTLPGRELVDRRITELFTKRPPSVGGFIWRPGRFFALEFDPAHKQQPSLVLLDSLEPDAGRRVLLDLMAIDPNGSTSMDWFVPSLDGTKIAVSLSKGGSENGTLHVYDVATGKETGDVIPRVQVGTGGGSLAWNADGSGFYYTRYPREGERPPEDLDFWQQVYFHKLGAPEAQDVYSMGNQLPRIAEIRLRSSEDGKHVLAVVANGDGGDFALYLLPPGGRWAQVSRFEDGVIDARFGRDGALWLLSKKNAPRRRVLRVPLATPVLAMAKVILDQQKGVIEQVVPTKTRLYVEELLGGPTRVRQFDLRGKELADQVPAPPLSTNAGLQRLDGDDVFFVSVSFVEPLMGYRYEAKKGALHRTVVHGTPLADFRDVEVVAEEATSKDGTKVPMFILQRRGTRRDGKNPTLLNGYGGYGFSTQPYYSDLRHVYLEQGVVLVYTALRGGGEFGEEWHDQGRLTRKQNVFDDFIACAQRLIELGYTSPGHLAIQGGSNGGLLMGAALTQRPELFRAVVSSVGIYDMLRVETSSNGQFNVTEFGSIKDPEQFKAMRAYSPYQNVKEGVAYPPVLFMTGANDPRVDPMQSRKMVARLQAVSKDPVARPVLLSADPNVGHGIGSPLKAIIKQQVDSHAFVFHELGIEVKPPQTVQGG